MVMLLCNREKKKKKKKNYHILLIKKAEINLYQNCNSNINKEIKFGQIINNYLYYHHIIANRIIIYMI